MKKLIEHVLIILKIYAAFYENLKLFPEQSKKE